MYQRVLFNAGWEFAKTPVGTEDPACFPFHPVDIPHDWMIYDTLNLYETSTGWYRKRFSLHREPDKEYLVRFDGVYMDSRVYLNGSLIKEWKYGYSAFEAELTPCLRDGENLLEVRVDYRCPNTRWYSGAGIFRDVFLITREHAHLLSDGIYVTTDMAGNLTVTAEAEQPGSQELQVRAEVLSGSEPLCSACGVCESREFPEPLRRPGYGSFGCDLSLCVPNPRLWCVEQPCLYTLRVTLAAGGREAEQHDLRIGFRTAQFTPDGGFFLNGRHVKLHGCCEHHDLGALGSAFNRSAMRRKLLKLREMGVNAIRTSHNMPAEGLMELADELGFLILSEAFDMWEWPKTEYDYHRFFRDWAERDVASWIRRDRSRPSVIGWSIGNEIYDTHVDEHGLELTKRLLGFVREFDYRCSAPVTHGSNYMPWSGAQACTDVLKLAGYNYAERLYAEHHAAHPDWCIYGSETASCLQSRGVYHFPRAESVLCNEDYQCSSLGNCTTGWGAKNTEACIIPDRDTPFCAGQFIWTGFDYIGEPTPYDTKNSYFGQYDTAGFPKDSAYLFRSAWTDWQTAPFVHIYPYWDFIEGELIDLRVASNAPRVELWQDGRKLAEKEFDRLHCSALTLDARVPFRPGVLTAIARDAAGRELAREEKRTFGDAASLRLSPENREVPAGTRELLFVDVDALDRSGIPVENANNRVRVEVTGAGRLVGLDNGDSTDYDPYKGVSRRLFSGKLLAIIAPRETPGEITVRVSSPGLTGSECTLRTLPGEPEAGISFLDENVDMPVACGRPEELPVRKIEISAPETVFSPDNAEPEFRIRVLPSDATYREELTYKLINPRGIETGISEITCADSRTVRLRCRADGEYRLRALCRTGTDRCHVFGEIVLKNEGFGGEVFDPYKELLAGLNTRRSDNLGNGIENGIGFPGGEESWFTFDNVDFGAFGSDTFTVSVFANTNDPVFLSVYDGVPGEGKLLGRFRYHVPPVWMVYQEQTYRLPHRLKGLHALSFAAADGYQLKSFRFEPQEKLFARLPAADCERIYGDSFTLGDDAVTDIGNNVFLDFGAFLCGSERPAGLEIEGRSSLEKNSIHILLRGSSETRVLAEFDGSETYVCRRFPLELPEDAFSLSLAFLPGSRFDLRSIRFLKRTEL